MNGHLADILEQELVKEYAGYAGNYSNLSVYDVVTIHDELDTLREELSDLEQTYSSLSSGQKRTNTLQQKEIGTKIVYICETLKDAVAYPKAPELILAEFEQQKYNKIEHLEKDNEEYLATISANPIEAQWQPHKELENVLINKAIIYWYERVVTDTFEDFVFSLQRTVYNLLLAATNKYTIKDNTSVHGEYYISFAAIKLLDDDWDILNCWYSNLDNVWNSYVSWRIINE